MNDIQRQCVTAERAREYARDRLAPDESATLESHCHGCARCGNLVERVLDDEDEAARRDVEGTLEERVDEPVTLPEWLVRAGNQYFADLPKQLQSSQNQGLLDRGIGAPEWQGEALARRLLDLTTEPATSWKRQVDIMRDWGRELAESGGAADASWLRTALLSWMQRGEHWQVRKAAADALGLGAPEESVAKAPSPGVFAALRAAYDRSADWLARTLADWEAKVGDFNARPALNHFDTTHRNVSVAGLDCKLSIVNERCLVEWSAEPALALFRVGIEWSGAADERSPEGTRSARVSAPLLFDAHSGKCVATLEAPNGADIRLLPLEPPGDVSTPSPNLSAPRRGSFAHVRRSVELVDPTRSVPAPFDA